MKTLATLIAVLALAIPAVAEQSPRPLPSAYIGRVGAADLRLLSPAHLKQAAQQMSYDVQQYKAAAATFRDDLKNHPDAKFSYLALCQLDAGFREEEYKRWAERTATTPWDLFQKGVTTYLYHLSYTVYSPEMGNPTIAMMRLHTAALYDAENGPLGLFKSLWSKEPDTLNGVLLAGVMGEPSLGRGKVDSAFLERLIEVSAGVKAKDQYREARENDWRSPIPEVKMLGKTTAALLAAAISNAMSQAGTYVPREGSEFGYGLDGKPVVRISPKTGAYTFLEGTQARFLRDWLQRIYDTYNLP